MTEELLQTLYACRAEVAGCLWLLAGILTRAQLVIDGSPGLLSGRQPHA